MTMQALGVLMGSIYEVYVFIIVLKVFEENAIFSDFVQNVPFLNETYPHSIFIIKEKMECMKSKLLELA